MIPEELEKLYTNFTGNAPVSITEIPSSGSNRRYFRISGKMNTIGAYGSCKDENETFLYIASHFKNKGLPVPEIYSVSDSHEYYLQEDLGDTLLFNAIEKGRITSVFSEDEKNILRKTMKLLPEVQFKGAEGLDFKKCYPQAEFNHRSILWDLNYFK